MLCKVGKTVRVSCVAILIIVALVGMSCSLNEVDDPLSSGSFRITKAARTTNQNGVGRRTFYRHETLIVNLMDLIKQEQTFIEIVRLSDDRTLNETVMVTDMDGNIMGLPVWHHIGLGNDGNPMSAGGDYLVHVLQPEKHEPRTILSIPFEVKDAPAPEPHTWVCNNSGSDIFGQALIGETVYMTGTGFVPGDNVRLLVISDVDTVFDGMGYADVSGGIETATINGDGSLPPTLVWTPPVTGGYDVVVDTEPFSEYNEGDAVSDVLLQGLVVQEPASEEDIFIDIASDEFGIHKSQFDSLDAIFATVCPYRQSLYNVNRDYWNTPGSENYRSNRSPMVWTPIAVTLHQEVWEAGDPIYTIRTVGTMQMTTNLQLNHRTSCVPTVRIRGACKPKYMNPLKLWPGPYDMIVDVNGNDVYDPGIDYLDGGSPGPGFTIPGELLPSDSVRIIATTDDDFVGRQFGTTKINIKVFNNLLQGHENVEIRVSVVIGPGRVIPGPSGSFKDKYGYLHLFTNEDGYVWCEFTDGQFGVMSRVRLEFYIDGKLYWQVVSLDQTTPHTHTQGIIIHDQGSGS